MGTIEKGIILTLEGDKDNNNNYTKARVQATSADGTSTLPLSVPWYLRGRMGNLSKGTEVVYALFDDATGVVLSRMDGNWNGNIEGDVTVSGNITADIIQNHNIVLLTHTHNLDIDANTTTAPIGGGT